MCRRTIVTPRSDYVRSESIHIREREVDDENNEQKGSKNAATDIHMTLS